MKKIYLLLVFTFVVSFANAQNPVDFIMTYEVDGENLNISVPVVYSSSNNYSVNFGDGNVLTNQSGESYHTYAAPGIYTVTLSGNYSRISFWGNVYPEKLKTIEQWGTAHWSSMEEAFLGCTNLTISATDTPDLSAVTSMKNMFKGAAMFNQPINNWDVSSVTDMEGLFSMATLFNQPLNNWDVSNVNNMKNMFYAAQAFNKDLSSWDVSVVANMEGLFMATPYNFPLNNWNVSAAITMKSMFSNAEAFNQPLDNWNVSGVTNMQEMFSNTYAFNQQLNNWNVSGVVNMQQMFDASAFNKPLNNWDVSSVENLQGMFKNSYFNHPLYNWNVSHVTTMQEMFAENGVYDQPLDNWNVSAVTNMQSMFRNTVFNQPLNNWNVSNVLSMFEMFCQTSLFNQPLSNWNVSSVTMMQRMFTGAAMFNQPIESWNVSHVVDMSSMFNSALAFNQPLNNWNVSAVTTMESMFSPLFNQPLNNWNVSNVLNMRGMFGSSFNQDISSWNFNPGVSFAAPIFPGPMYFVGRTSMDTNNYDLLLGRFAELRLENKVLRSNDLHYCDYGVRQYLISQLGWVISGDSLDESCTGNTILGNIRFDENANGCDNADINAANIMVGANNGQFSYRCFSDAQAQYNLELPEGSYTLNLVNVPSYYTVTPAISSFNFTGTGATQPLDFCLIANQSVQDLRVTILPLTQARPGFEAQYRLVVQNVGTTTVTNATANFGYDTLKQVYVTASQVPVAIQPNPALLQFNIASIDPFETKTIDITLRTAMPPFVGTPVLELGANVATATEDITPDDNRFGFNQEVVNSFDPNDKQVLQGEIITISQINNYLDYIVRFQNTGTASAITVRIEDVLDEKLDWNTLIPVTASHSYSTRVTDGNHVEFIFDNINLPHEAADEPGSHGFIAFKIKPKHDIALGDVIAGSAGIYFDYNEPIITNTVTTLLQEAVAVTDKVSQGVTFYPNPVTDVLHIMPMAGISIESVTIFNLQGRKLLLFTRDVNTIDLKDLSAGIYSVQVKTNSGITNHQVIKN